MLDQICPVHSSVPIHQCICPPCFSSMLKLMWTNPGWWSQRTEKTSDWGRSMTLGEVARRSQNPLWHRWFPDLFFHFMKSRGKKRRGLFLTVLLLEKCEFSIRHVLFSENTPVFTSKAEKNCTWFPFNHASHLLSHFTRCWLFHKHTILFKWGSLQLPAAGAGGGKGGCMGEMKAIVCQECCYFSQWPLHTHIHTP